MTPPLSQIEARADACIKLAVAFMLAFLSVALGVAAVIMAVRR